MKTVELIYDLDCPNVPAARSNLMKALSSSGQATHWTEWDRSSPDSPAHAKQYGSPTILVDGNDVAGEQPREDSTCCRLYRGANGAMQGVPSVAIISAALQSTKTSSCSPIPEGKPGWKSSLATIPGIALAFLPKIACPACWPAYAGLLSSLGLGFLVEVKYLLPLTVVFLIFAVGALAFRARTHRGYGPFVLGLSAAAIVLIGKFSFDSDAAMYGGITFLVMASFWNAWPIRQRDTNCPACIGEDSPVVSLQKEVVQ